MDRVRDRETGWGREAFKIPSNLFNIVDRSIVSVEGKTRRVCLVHWLCARSSFFTLFSVNISAEIPRCGLEISKFSRGRDIRIARDHRDRRREYSNNQLGMKRRERRFPKIVRVTGFLRLVSATTAVRADGRCVIKTGGPRGIGILTAAYAIPRFSQKGRKETCTWLPGSPPAFDVSLPTFFYRTSSDVPVSVGWNKSRLANTGRCELLLHSRDRSVSTRHAYLQREVHFPNSQFFFLCSFFATSVPIIVYPERSRNSR